MLMKSPFPGMDPYIEACGLWGDFHDDLVGEIKRALAAVAPERYLVRTAEREYIVVVEETGAKKRAFLSDVSVSAARAPKRTGTNKGSTTVAEGPSLAEPVTMRACILEEHRESFVEIFEAGPDQRLVTGIEGLSPSNKRPGTPGWKRCQRKRQSLMLDGVNLVEIDLLRGGPRMPMLDPWPNSPYALLVARAFLEHKCSVWRAAYKEPLPPIRVPLAKPDPDLTLNLQPMVEAIYERSRYARSIDYRKALSPPLSSSDAAWLKQRLQRRARPA
jgi:Protein of unknown function (DUF4058)